MKIVTRTLAASVLAAAAVLLVAQNASSRPKATPAASPAASTSPAPLPTATPEPPETAIPRLEAKIKANPTDKDSLIELSGYYLQTNRADQALPLTQRLMSQGIKTAQVYYLDGIAQQNLGHIREATADFEQAANLEPTNAQVLLTLTELYLRTNRPADAERVAKRATTFNATDKRVFENYGLVLEQEGKFDDARTQFQAAAKLDPKDADPILFEARSYVAQKNYPLASSDFDRALAVDPKNTDALLGKARLQTATHDVKDAVATYETLLAIAPSDEAKASVLVEEYTAYRDEKMNDQALATLKRAEAAYPNVPAVHIAFGDYYASIGKDQHAAEAEWKTALGPNRNVPDALSRLGTLALSQKKTADAIGYFKRLTEVSPNDPTAWFTLGQVYNANGQFQEARSAYGHSFSLQQSPQALAGVGAADLALKNYKECTGVFQAIDKGALDLMKANPSLFYAYGKCAEGNNDKAQARAAYLQLKPFVKPGTQLEADVNRALQRVGSSPAPKPKPTNSPVAHH